MQLLHQRKLSFVSQNNPGHPTFLIATTLMSHIQHQEKLHCSSICCETCTTIWGHIPTHLQINAAESKPRDTSGQDVLQTLRVYVREN